MFAVASVMFDRHSYNSSEGDGALIVTLISSLAADFPFAINVIPIRLTTESKKPSLITVHYLMFFLKVQTLYQILQKLRLKLGNL